MSGPLLNPSLLRNRNRGGPWIQFTVSCGLEYLLVRSGGCGKPQPRKTKRTTGVTDGTLPLSAAPFLWRVESIHVTIRQPWGF